MFNWFLSLIGWDYNQKQIDKILPIIKEIQFLYAQYDSLTDQEIQDKTNEFKQRIQDGASLDSLLPEAFAVVKGSLEPHVR